MLWEVENYGSSSDDLPPKLIRALGNHEFFGDEVHGSADGARPKCSIVAKTYCVLMALTRQDFDTACPRLKGGATLRDLSEQYLNHLGRRALRRACHGNGKQPANESSVVPSGTGLRRVFTTRCRLTH